MASLPKMSRGKLTPLVATSILGGMLRREAQQVRGADSGRENTLLSNGQRSDLGHVRPAGSEGRLPRPQVEALRQPLDQGLGGPGATALCHCRDRHSLEVGQPPDPFTAGLNPVVETVSAMFNTPTLFRLALVNMLGLPPELSDILQLSSDALSIDYFPFLLSRAHSPLIRLSHGCALIFEDLSN